MVRLDPRTKIFIVLMFLAFIFIKTPVWWQVGFSCILLLTIFLSGKHKKIFSSVRYFLYFVPLTFLIHMLLSSVSLSFKEIGLSIESEDVVRSIMFTLRILNMFLVMGFALHWIGGLDILDSVYVLLRPLSRIGLWVDDIFVAVIIGLRFFPIVKKEYREIRDGYRAFFGVGSENSLSGKVLETKNLMVPLMVSVFRKADVLSCSMKVRGYGQKRRSCFRKLAFNRYDYMIFCAMAIILGVLWYVEKI
ncbi:MAG: hypothetical protein DRP88_06145 [Candidatus Neomarinimicrobiota bacterium]|nr:MAG: hypothetical protein DRP88_06145 [Candidatus Neomarinimicrobiota bacterium]